MPFDIELDDYTPIRDADRSHLSGPKNAEVIERKFGPLIDMGIFEESKSPWKAQLVVVKGKRVAHDFINVNNRSISNKIVDKGNAEIIVCQLSFL